jgi:ribosomal protein L11 methyltransferase
LEHSSSSLDSTQNGLSGFVCCDVRWTSAVNNFEGEFADIVVAFLSEFAFDHFETEEDYVKAYADVSADSSELRDSVMDALSALEVSVEWSFVEKQNWNEEWEKNFFEPLEESGFYVKAPFHPEAGDHIEYTITIQPRMSFGTGHHATTQLMLKGMKHHAHLFSGDETAAASSTAEAIKVLDMGTGTGILAIAAEMLGAKEVLGVEIDDWVVDNANDNVAINQVKHTTMVCGTAEYLGGVADAYYHIVLANIHREVILADLAEYVRVLKAKGLMLISGLQAADEAIVVDTAQKLGLNHETTEQRGEWICIHFFKN